MNYENFEDIMNQLIYINNIYNDIITNLMNQMEHTKAPEEKKFSVNFKIIKKEHRITYEQICGLLAKNGYTVNIDTLKSYGRKGRIIKDSVWSKQIAEVLGVKTTDLTYGKNHITTSSFHAVDKRSLFMRLSKQNQKAIFQLVVALLMKETVPEYFQEF